jgi:RNA polymerase sigma-70 factor (ECF subfamily)
MPTSGDDDAQLDQALVRRMRGGDERAFDEFFDLYFQPLYRFALARVRRPELAREMAQATVCKALEKLHLFRGESLLFTWMCAICRFEISAHHRRESREPAGELLSGETEIDAAMADPLHVDAEQALLKGEVSRLVHQTVDALPPRYAQALLWKYADGVPVVEIARRLGSSVKAAESLLTRAREAFRSRYPRALPSASASSIVSRSGGSE